MPSPSGLLASIGCIMYAHRYFSTMLNQLLAGNQYDLVVPLLHVTDSGLGSMGHDIATVANCLIEQHRTHDVISLFSWLIDRRFFNAAVFELIIAYEIKAEAWSSLETCVSLIMVCTDGNPLLNRVR